jgi:hypothetical protein
MGTKVIPEFPVIVAVLILATLMVAIVRYTRFAKDGIAARFPGRA